MAGQDTDDSNAQHQQSETSDKQEKGESCQELMHRIAKTGLLLDTSTN